MAKDYLSILRHCLSSQSSTRSTSLPTNSTGGVLFVLPENPQHVASVNQPQSGALVYMEITAHEKRKKEPEHDQILLNATRTNTSGMS